MSQEPRRTKPLRRVRNRVEKSVREAEARARKRGRRRDRASLYVWRLLVLVVSQWRRDQCPQHAAGLSFKSVLSVVPALALAVAAFRATGAMEAESSLIKFLSRETLPLSAEEISARLLSLSENITFESMGLVGLISTLLIAFFTFNSLEHTINDIWRVEKRRSLPKRLLVFYLTATIGSLLVGMSLYQAAQFGLSDGWSEFFLSVSIAFGAIFLANYVLPYTEVRVGAAVVGALVTTVLSEVAKLGFATYVTRFAMERYSDVYGPLAAVPLCLVWIYWSWLMLLLGVEVSHSVQNLRVLEGARRRVRVQLADEIRQRVCGTTATLVLAHIAVLEREGTAASRVRLSEDFDLSLDAIRILAARLRDGGLLKFEHTSRTWRLARPAQDIAVLDVLDIFSETSEREGLHLGPPVEDDTGALAAKRLSQLRDQGRELAKNFSLAELIAEENQEIHA